jgi:NADH-quinone oxidoreductase subunit J
LNKIPAAISAILFFIVMAVSVVSISGTYVPTQQSITGISKELFSTYIIPFELLSVVLVAGIIGMFHTAEDDE